jgi:hypothetical protein
MGPLGCIVFDICVRASCLRRAAEIQLAQDMPYFKPAHMTFFFQKAVPPGKASFAPLDGTLLRHQ